MSLFQQIRACVVQALDSASGHLYHLYGELVGKDLDQLLNQGLGAAARENLKQLGHNHWSLQEND